VGDVEEAAEVEATACPQFMQNRAWAASGLPQFWHATGMALPQFMQNLAPAGLAVWQLEHFIAWVFP
jgi:hypothetical protein